MRIVLAALCLFILPGFAANQRLYLKDGNYHIVREYEVKSDRVRYYSVERGEWEEIPLTLVDLDRTKTELQERSQALAEETKLLAAEDQAERELQAEIMKIPQDAGVYQLVNGELRIFRHAESKVRTNKGRSVLKAIAPIPIVSGKGTLEIDGEKSLNVINADRPEFYVQLEKPERFAIIRLTPRKGIRIAERLTFVPVTKEVVEERDEVEIFRKQMTPDGLYKIWPVKPLEPGEYAVAEYTDGELNIQVFDFSYQPGAPDWKRTVPLIVEQPKTP
jgi:hypothetical protein